MEVISDHAFEPPPEPAEDENEPCACTALDKEFPGACNGAENKEGDVERKGGSKRSNDF